MGSTQSKRWFITGAGRGFGQIWAAAALQRGDKVAVTTRDIAALAPLVEECGEAILPLALDVTQRHAVFAAVAQAHGTFGASTSYAIPNHHLPLSGALSKLTVGGGANWESRTWTADPTVPANTSGLIGQPAFALVNLMARYDMSKRLSAQRNIDNAVDKTHHAMFAAFDAILTPRVGHAALPVLSTVPRHGYMT